MAYRSYEDAILVLAATTGAMSALAGVGAPYCRGLRFVTAGTFIGLTKRNGSNGAVTITGAVGEVVDIAFQSKTGGTSDVLVLL